MKNRLLKLAVASLIFLLSLSIASASTYAAANRAVLKDGMNGSAVKTLQSNLKKLGFFSQNPTGYYGDYTIATVKKFQKKYKIKVTGVVATLTYNKLDALLKPAPKKTASKTTPSKNVQNPVSLNTQKPDGLKLGSANQEVLKLQNNLSQLGYMKVTPTGDFGTITEAALIQFQKYYGMDTSGVADSKTLSVIDRLLGKSESNSRGDDVVRGATEQGAVNGATAGPGSIPKADYQPINAVKLEWIPGIPNAPFLKGVGKYDGVVIHYTASPNDTAQTEANHEMKHWSTAFVHEFIDATEIIQVSDPDYKAWGAGERANDRFIHLELCDAANQNDFNISYQKITLRAAEYLYINKLGVAPAKPDGTGTLWSHMDVTNYLGFTNHTDPIAYLAKWGKTWNDVISSVTAKYNALVSGKDPQIVDEPASNINDGNTPDGSTPDGSTIDGDTNSENSNNGKPAEGNTTEGSTTNGNSPDGNAADGSTSNGNPSDVSTATDGNAAVSP